MSLTKLVYNVGKEEGYCTNDPGKTTKMNRSSMLNGFLMLSDFELAIDEPSVG